MEGKTQETAAAKAGICVRSARKWQSGPLPSETKQERQWRTRSDPFDGVWEEEIEPLLRPPWRRPRLYCSNSCPGSTGVSRSSLSALSLDFGLWRRACL